MKAAVMTALDDLQVQTVPRPLPGSGEVAIDIRSVGICGSDAAYLHLGRIGDWVVSGPFVLGHETAGTISTVGDGVDPARIGTRVAIEPGTPCRTCEQCVKGRYHLCPDLAFLATPPYPGCLAERIVIPAEQAHLIPDEMSFDEAALVEPASVGLWAARRVGLTVGDRLLITGAGPVGILAGLMAKVMGAAEIAICDPSPDRRRIAESLGLRAIDPSAAESNGLAADYDVLFECSGNADALRSGLQRMAPAGRVALIGMPHEESVQIPIASLIPREISLHPVNRYAHTWPTVIDLIAGGRIPTAGLVTHHFPLAEAAQAFATQQSSRTAMKVMIHPQP